MLVKKIRIVQGIGFVLFLIYLALIISELIIGYLKDLQLVVFSGVLAIVSLTMIYKGVLLKSASTLWFAMCLILLAICLIVFELIDIGNENYYLLSLIPIIASLINIAIFHNLFYIKIIILNLSVTIPLIITQFTNFTILINLLFFGISLIIGIIICRNISLEREKING